MSAAPNEHPDSASDSASESPGASRHGGATSDRPPHSGGGGGGSGGGEWCGIGAGGGGRGTAGGGLLVRWPGFGKRSMHLSAASGSGLAFLTGARAGHTTSPMSCHASNVASVMCGAESQPNATSKSWRCGLARPSLSPFPDTPSVRNLQYRDMLNKSTSYPRSDVTVCLGSHFTA